MSVLEIKLILTPKPQNPKTPEWMRRILNLKRKFRSPFNKGLQDAVKHRILAPQTINDSFDHRVTLGLLLHCTSGLILGNCRGKPIGSNISEFLRHCG